MISINNIRKFKTLTSVKTSLIFLYLALTLPIPFFAVSGLKLISYLLVLFGFFLIFNITNDYLEISDLSISYKTNFISNFLGKKSWEIFWKDITNIKSLPTSQGSKVFYFITNKNYSFLIPQRIEKFEELVLIIGNKTKLNSTELRIISPLWTYRLLTILSLIMIVGEIIFFIIKYY